MAFKTQKNNIILPTDYLYNNFTDSRRWDLFNFRIDDLIINSYGKSGTTFCQNIVGLLLFDGEKDLPIAEMSPWLDVRVEDMKKTFNILEKQIHRRFMKTHTPPDKMRFSLNNKMIIFERDARDVAMSFYDKFTHSTDKYYTDINSGNIKTKIGKPPESFDEYFSYIMNTENMPGGEYFNYIKSCHRYSNLDNVLILHFTDFLSKPKEVIKEIADFLEIPLNQTLLNKTYKYSHFDYMKKHGQKVVPMVGWWEKGHETFMNKGINGRWKEKLNPNLSKQYEEQSIKELGPEIAYYVNKVD